MNKKEIVGDHLGIKEIPIDQSARLGQAINLAHDLVLRDLNIKDMAYYEQEVTKKVFTVTLPMINNIREQFYQQKQSFIRQEKFNKTSMKRPDHFESLEELKKKLPKDIVQQTEKIVKQIGGK